MERSDIMRRVRSRDTKPELQVRRLLRSLDAVGYRLNRADLPGTPDIAYLGRRKAIFVHGCFWHGHDCKRGSRRPKRNADYWHEKIRRNVERDQRAQNQLIVLGWRTLVIWECDLKNTEEVRQSLRAFLST